MGTPESLQTGSMVGSHRQEISTDLELDCTWLEKIVKIYTGSACFETSFIWENSYCPTPPLKKPF
jgi:hypothetical protein